MTDAAEFDPRALRRAFGAFATGVTIVTTLDPDGQPVGLTANSFTSVSLDPPLVLVCVGAGSTALPAFRAADRFAVSVLAADQRDAAMVFATRGADRFAAVRWAPRVTGAPVIEGCAAWFDCRLQQLMTLGDHDIAVGRVVAFHRDAARPLGYHAGRFVEVGAPVRLAAIVTHDAGVLLREDPDQGLFLPSASAFGPAEDAASLLGLLSAMGALAGQPAPVWAYDDGPVHVVVYRAEAPAGFAPGPGWRAAAWGEALCGMASAHEAAALRRMAEGAHGG